MTTAISIALYIPSWLFVAAAGTVIGKDRENSKALILLVFSLIFFVFAAALQVFG